MPSGDRDAASIRGNIRFESVDFAYTDERPVLKDFDLDIPSGTSVALMGPSGSGKTTIGNLLLRLYDPTRGRISIDGIDVRNFDLESLRSRIGVVLQETDLFADTVRANITCGVTDISDEKIVEAARLARAHDFIQSLPLGYDTVLGERGVDLSPGQRQRIAIARAIVRDVAIAIFDEPTTGLDDRNRHDVLDALSACAAGRTAVFVTHDLDLAERADEVVYLAEGRLCQRGPLRKLLSEGGELAAARPSLDRITSNDNVRAV